MGAEYIQLVSGASRATQRDPASQQQHQQNFNHELVTITAQTVDRLKQDENAWIKTQEQLILREINRIIDNRRWKMRNRAKEGKNYIKFSFRSDKIKYFIDEHKRNEMIRNIQAVMATGFRIHIQIESRECEGDCGIFGGAVLLCVPFIGIPLIAYSVYNKNRYHVKCRLSWISTPEVAVTRECLSCKRNIDSTQMDTHVRMCGKYEMCPHCNLNIPAMDFAAHLRFEGSHAKYATGTSISTGPELTIEEVSKNTTGFGPLFVPDMTSMYSYVPMQQ